MARMARNVSVNANETNETIEPARIVYGKQADLKFNIDASKWNAAAIDKGLARLEKMGNQTAQLAHELCVASIRHYVAFGDYTKLASLFKAVKHGMGNSRVTALKVYVKNNCPSLIVSDAYAKDKNGKATRTIEGVELTHKKGEQRRYLAEETATKAGNQEALLVPFWVEERAEQPYTFDFASKLQALLQQAVGAHNRIATLKKNGKPIGEVKIPTIGRLAEIATEFGVVVEIGKGNPINVAHDKGSPAPAGN